jgi:hypothetical protein
MASACRDVLLRLVNVAELRQFPPEALRQLRSGARALLAIYDNGHAELFEREYAKAAARLSRDGVRDPLAVLAECWGIVPDVDAAIVEAARVAIEAPDELDKLDPDIVARVRAAIARSDPGFRH